MKEADSLEDIADHMGEDFGFGFDPDEGDPNKPPAVPPVPTELTEERACTSVTFEFPARKCVESLVVQILPAELAISPADPFASFSLRKQGCLVQDVGRPNETTRVVVGELRTATSYYFRLVARNSRGTVASKPTVAITTLEYTPPRGDMSGFLYLYPVRDSDKKGRRLSIKTIKEKGLKRDYVWVVQDGNLLTWSDGVDGKELGRLLIAQIKCVLSDDSLAESNRIVIQDVKDREFNFEAESHDPKVTSAQVCRMWLLRLRRLLGMAEGDFGKASNTALLM